jgi:rhamnosyltransferase
MKIAAVVILYHPTESTIANIKSYCDEVDKVYIFDNTGNVSVIKDDLQFLPNVDYHNMGTNAGIPKVLNDASQLAIQEGFDWLLTMDQDSKFLETSLTKYIQCFSQFEHKETVAMFGTSNKRGAISSTTACQFEENICLMTSGTLLNLALFNTIGDFDEALFIDCVDHDYCIRSMLAGYRIIRFSNIFLQHELGRFVFAASIKTLFLIKKKKEVHPPIRLYYMIRNMLYLTKKFEADNLPVVKQLKYDVFSKVKIALLYSRKSADIIKYVKMGYKDFHAGHMGRIALDIQ